MSYFFLRFKRAVIMLTVLSFLFLPRFGFCGEMQVTEVAALLSKARSASEWTHWSKTTLKVHMLSSTPGPPEMFAGFSGIVTIYRSPDGRLDVRSEQDSNPDKNGKFIQFPMHEESVFGNGRFLTFGFAKNLPPGPSNGIVRIYKQENGLEIAKTFGICGDSVGGFLDGNFVSDDGNGRSAIELARNGHFVDGITQDRVNGVECSVGQWETSIGALRVWIAPSEGYNILRCSLAGPLAPLSKQQPLWVPSSVLFEVSAFEKIGNEIIPAAGQCETISFNKDTGQVWKTVTTAERIGIQLNPQFNDPTLFTSKNIPDDLRVQFEDAATPQHIRYIWWHGEPKPAVDVAALGQIDATLNHALGPPAEIIINEHSYAIIWVGFAVAAGGFVLVLFLANRRKSNHNVFH